MNTSILSTGKFQTQQNFDLIYRYQNDQSDFKMSRIDSDNETNSRGLVEAIVEFLRSELRNATAPEDRDSLQIAIECLELAYGLEHQQGELHLAGCPHRQRVHRSLLDMFNQAMNPPSVKDKQQAESFKNSGNEKMAEELYEEATIAYTQAIALDQWNAIYYCNRASAHLGLERYYDAIADCRQALSLNPDYAKAYGRMGQAYALMGRHRHAARCFRQALELEPDNERYVNNLRVAESQASRDSENSERLQSLLESFLGVAGGSGTFPTSGTITIITEVTPTSEESQLTSEEAEPTVIEESDPQPESIEQPDENIASNNDQNTLRNNFLSLLPTIFGRRRIYPDIQHSGNQSHGRETDDKPDESDLFEKENVIDHTEETQIPAESDSEKTDTSGNQISSNKNHKEEENSMHRSDSQIDIIETNQSQEKKTSDNVEDAINRNLEELSYKKQEKPETDMNETDKNY